MRARVLETPTRDEFFATLPSPSRKRASLHPRSSEKKASNKTAIPHAHYVAYHRLRNTGWLSEQHEKWDVLVDMHPDAFMVIGSIADFANSRVRVAGAVVEVKSNLESASEEPESMAKVSPMRRDGGAVRKKHAADYCRHARHRRYDPRQSGRGLDPAYRSSRICRWPLIADYKQLKTSNNPYRYRRQISTLTNDLLHDTEWRDKTRARLHRSGRGPFGKLSRAAEDRIVSELEKIRQVFEDVGPFMERIEDFRDRLERRVRTTVHYMDVMGEGSAERLARLIERLAALGDSEVELRLRTPDVGFPITAKALYTPPPPRAAPEKSRFKMPQRDPYLKAYVAATTAFDKMVRVNPARLAAFIYDKIEDRETLSSSEIPIDSIEDLFAFRSLPSLAAFGSGAEIGPYRIVLEDGRTDNEWINLQAFRIERIERIGPL